MSASSSRVTSPRVRAADSRPAGVGELQADVAAGDAAFQLVGGPLGDQLPPIKDRDPVGKLVRLFQVLRGKQDRDAAGHEVADDLPHGVAAARVQAGGRLVEEDHARVADQGHRQVEPAPHAAGVGGGRLSGRIDQIEAVEQVGGTPSGLRVGPGGAGPPSTAGSLRR